MRTTPKKVDKIPIGRPPQDAQTIAELGIKSGWLYKRSDFTKKWNSRYCVLKRSAFLYYYESEVTLHEHIFVANNTAFFCFRKTQRQKESSTYKITELLNRVPRRKSRFASSLPGIQS
jgi:hypothetical protein